MTTPTEAQPAEAPPAEVRPGALDLRVLRVPDGPVRATAVRLDRLSTELEAVAEPSEPDLGQHRRLVDGRLANPVCLPAHELSRLLGALAGALHVVSRGVNEADDDAEARSRLLQRDLP